MPLDDIDRIDDAPPDGGGGATTGDVNNATRNPVSGDWALLSGFPGGTSPSKTANFSTLADEDPVGLNGDYTALGVSASQISLSSPELVNSNWGNIEVRTEWGSPNLSTDGDGWVGPFVLDMPTLTQVVANFVAPQGMYRVTEKGKQRPNSVQVELEVTPVNAAGVAIGAPETFYAVVSGNGTDKKSQGVTLYATVSFVGRCKVRAKRITPSDYTTKDTVVDEVEWRDCYGTAPVAEAHFGDVTTVHSRTLATAGATSVKERKLNCRATRKVLQRNIDDTFGPALVASRNAADILCHMALDPYIGNRSLDELDVPQIYDTLDDVVTYFGINDVREFGYTFDQDKISSEEMMQTVAQAVFCTAYRQGSKLRLFFERETEDSVLLFNHRNKVPGSEQRTVRFGYLNDYDGVELDYISSVDGAKLTTYIPDDRTAVKPRKIELLGVIDRRADGAVPFLHASRAWNKIRYQHTTSEFQALAEASQLLLSQRIEVADNTRPDVFDGEVRGQVGLVLELSQPFTPAVGVDYVIFLQLDDGTVENLVCTAGPDKWHCTLAGAPSRPLVLDDTAWALTGYQITGNDGKRPTAFVVSEKGSFSKHVVPVQAINYDPRYYQADLDYHP